MSEGAVHDNSATAEPVQTVPDTPAGDVQVSTPETPEIVSAPPSWRDGLSDDLRSHPELQKFKNFEDVAKSYVTQSELVGRKGVLLPKEGDPEDANRFYSQLGRPDTVEGYDLGDFAPPEGLPWSENVQSSMLEAMHESGLTTDQVNSVIRAYAESQSQEFEQITKQIEQARGETELALKREYGAQFDANMDLGNRAFAMAAGDKMDEIRQTMLQDGTMLGDYKPFIDLFVKMGKSLGEDSLRGGGSRPSFTKSPEQAKSELSALGLDEGFQKALMDRNHPEHDRAVERKSALYAMAYPETETTE